MQYKHHILVLIFDILTERPSDDQLLDVEKRKIEIEEEKLYVFKEILMEIRGLRAEYVNFIMQFYYPYKL